MNGVHRRQAGRHWTRWSALLAALTVVLAATGSVNAAVDEPQFTPGFTDSFDDAVDRDPSYGLNDSLAQRQRAAQRGVTYTRVPGVWYPASAPRAWYSQVNHPAYPDVLSLWLGHSAVRMDAPVVADGDGRIGVRAVLDPVTGDVASGQWASLVLTPDHTNAGYATNAQVDLGIVVRSTGVVSVFHNGTVVGSLRATPAADGRFSVTGLAQPGGRTATVTVNGVSTTVSTTRPFAPRNTLFLGAYLSDPSAESTFDDLAVSAVDTAALRMPPTAGLRHFGYFAARLGPTGGSHLPEVIGRSNLNHVNISDYTEYVARALDDCPPAGCAVYTGFEFFTGCDSPNSPNCRLYDSYQERWQKLAAAVTGKLSRVGAFYLLDEPYHHGARPADVATAARTIKATFPSATVMLVEAGYKVPTIEVPTEVDWVGFDEYCTSVTHVEQLLNTLEGRTASHQKLFLFPPAAPLRACDSTPGLPRTDGELARLQWDYMALAERHPRVAGIMPFGLWVDSTPVSALPATVDAHERIMARIIAS